MNILVVTQYFYPEQFKINSIVCELVKRGNKVTVFTGLPNYPEGEIFEGYADSFKCEDEYCGAKVIRCKCRPRHKGAVNLLCNYLSFALQCSKKIRKFDERVDAVFVYGVSPVTQAVPALAFKKKFSVPVVYYCLDLWPEAVRGQFQNYKQKSEAHPIHIAAKFLTQAIYRHCDLILNKSDDFAEYNSELLHVPKCIQKTLYEYAESNYLEVKEAPEDNGIVDFVFIGNIGKIQNCDVIVRAYNGLKNKEGTRLHFVGDGSSLEEVMELTSRLKLEEYVSFHGRCSQDKVIEYYNLSDACILTLSNRTKTGLTIPAKLPSYMAAARPIIASINGSAADIVKQADCGYVCKADDAEELTLAMEAFLSDYDRSNAKGINGRRYFNEHFTPETFIDSLLVYLNDAENAFSGKS